MARWFFMQLEKQALLCTGRCVPDHSQFAARLAGLTAGMPKFQATVHVPIEDTQAARRLSLGAWYDVAALHTRP